MSFEPVRASSNPLDADGTRRAFRSVKPLVAGGGERNASNVCCGVKVTGVMLCL